MRTALRLVVVLGCVGLVVESSKRACYDGQYICQSSGVCIPNRWVCDGYEDCLHGDDEDSCYFTTYDYTTDGSSCYEDHYKCEHGWCLPNSRVCDGIEDCPYSDDEIYCNDTDTTDWTDVTSCPGDYYQCLYDGECIPNSWVCDDYADCDILGDDEENCTTLTSPHPQLCEDPFEYIYDSCVFVNPFTITPWDEARYLCEKFNSDLVVLDDYNFYAELLQYIRNKGLDSHSYWVGATDRVVEGVWRWVDYSFVLTKAPLWALYGCTGDYQLEPRPSDAQSQDCGFLDQGRGLYMSDASCDESFATICQARLGTKETKDREAN